MSWINIRDFQNHDSWVDIKSALESHKEVYMRKLIEIDGEYNEKKYTEHDITRLTIQMINLFVNTPDLLLTQLKENSKTTEDYIDEQYDSIEGMDM